MTLSVHPRDSTPAALPDDPAARPLVVTADEVLLDELLRLCAAAGVTPAVAADAGSARRSWADAPLVVVGPDLADAIASAGIVRRDGVVVVTSGGSGADLWACAVAIGAERVFVVPAEQDLVIDTLSNCLDRRGRDAPLVSVVSGCGGAGGSCLAGALALVAARGDRRAMLVDADPLGGGIDLVLGSESAVGLRWPDLATTDGRVSGRSLRSAVPRSGELAVLSWDRREPCTIEPASMRAVLTAARRAHELVVVDVPRRFDAAGREALAGSTTTVLVVPADVRSIAAADRVRCALRELTTDVRLVVRTPGPSGLDATSVAETLGLPLAACVGRDRRIARAIDDGLGPLTRRRGPVVRAARTLLGVVGGLEVERS